ncbi:methyl-accepting chemotaxis protein [Vibrio sonorensis]|uniref:methyl-accepting chemotaxis protein n=1 Tax=Vibrio sonorensis TaxID=1004316 RepID=UPI0008D9EECC|nr:methyl-accepting chemotaxis protein [Vibrio sonorensis]
MKRLSISYKIRLPLIAIMVSSLVVTVLSVYLVNAQQNLGTTINSIVSPAQANLQDAYRDLYQVKVAARGIADAKSQSELEHHITEYTDNASKLVPRLEKVTMLNDANMLDQESANALNQLVVLAKNWVALHQPLVENTDDAATYYAQHRDALEKDFIHMTSTTSDINDQIELLNQSFQQELSRISFLIALTVEIGCVIVLLVGLFAFWATARYVVKPVKRINSVMNEIANGEGDLSQRISVESEDELGSVAAAFNRFTGKIHQTVEQVIISSNAVRCEMENIKTLTQGIAQFSSNQQQESEAVAAAVHQMQQTSESVSSNAQEAAEASGNANSEADQTSNTLESTVDSISMLSAEVTMAGEVINDLESEVSNIVSILDVIRGIADQTNLLALNAAIEAARAGEQGRGFAVVAEEVRSLASRTQSSTGEIQAMIEKLQSGANQAVEVMDSSRESGANTIEAAGNASQSLQNIRCSIEQMNRMNTHIATAASQQLSVSNEVNSNVHRIAENTTQMVEMVNSADNACASLSQQCAHLDALVAEFKV